MRGFTLSASPLTAPMVTMTSLHIAVLPPATMVRSGLMGTASLALARGFTALVAFRVT
jgi:hypothetical protein